MTKKAFTLIEVLIATVILVVVIGAIVAVETGNIKLGSSSKYKLQANGVGQAAINTVKSIGETTLVGGSVGGDANVCNDPNDKDKCPAGVYFMSADSTIKLCQKSGDPDKCLDPNDSTKTPMLCPIAPTESTKVICNDPDATTNIGGKDFNRTVIIP
jgi:prepilin-type N-terminal cleavage/methylation domain-containing protein